MAALVVIDPLIADIETLLEGLAPDLEVLLLQPELNGLRQIADHLRGKSGYDVIHILSHGSPGSLQLGASLVTQEILSEYQLELKTIGESLTDSGDLLLYSCNVAQGEVGQQFVEALAINTGADVAASDDLTGAAILGGDWHLETIAGAVTSLPLAIPDYTSLLDGPASNNYDIGLMADLAEMANAAYDSGHSLKNLLAQHGWTPIQSTHTDYVQLDSGGGLEVLNAYGFAATREYGGEKQMVISFRGTNDLLDWIGNISPWGFTQYYRMLRPLVEEALRQAVDGGYNKIYLTGHSLGGGGDPSSTTRYHRVQR